MDDWSAQRRRVAVDRVNLRLGTSDITEGKGKHTRTSSKICPNLAVSSFNPVGDELDVIFMILGTTMNQTRPYRNKQSDDGR
jgi:hypothetical protein